VLRLIRGPIKREWGCWEIAKGRTFRDVTAWISCPECGHVGSLEKHEIDYEGNVSPLVECGKEACGYTVEIKLVDWDPFETIK